MATDSLYVENFIKIRFIFLGFAIIPYPPVNSDLSWSYLDDPYLKT